MSPTFGSAIDGLPYVVRPSAYAVVRNGTGEIAIVQTPRGHFLPGGGIDAGEDAVTTIQREAREECGLLIKPGEAIGNATEIVSSAEENACFEKRSEFFAAAVIGFAEATEPLHRLVWLRESAALDLLTYESHRWAVRRRLKADASTWLHT